MGERKVPVIELMEYNTLLSLFDFFSENFKDVRVNNKKIEVMQSFSDRNIAYRTPAFSIELLYRRNRSIGFGDYYGDIDTKDRIIEIEGTIFEYRVQLNVYSNTRGEIHKWSSILDEILKNGEEGIPLNTYYDNGQVKQANIGNISYNFSSDVRSNNMVPNIVTYDFHTIYEVKMKALQQYTVAYDIMDAINIIGKVEVDTEE